MKQNNINFLVSNLLTNPNFRSKLDDILKGAIVSETSLNDRQSVLNASSVPTKRTTASEPLKEDKSGAQKRIEESLRKYDKIQDIFADISKKAVGSEKGQNEEIQTLKKPSQQNDELSDTMKKSNHLYLQIASKYVNKDQEKMCAKETKTTKDEKETLNLDPRDSFSLSLLGETEKLCEEMNQKLKNERLNLAKNVKYSDDKIIKEGESPDQRLSTKETKILKGLGVEVKVKIILTS